MAESARDRLPEPEPTKEDLVEFVAVAQGLFDDLFELISTDTGDYKDDGDEINTENLWIDNKPIYRQVWSGTTDTGASTIVSAGIAVDSIISCYVRLVDLNGDFVGTDSNETNLSVSLNSQGSFLINHNAASLQGRPYTIIAQYTKLD